MNINAALTLPWGDQPRPPVEFGAWGEAFFTLDTADTGERYDDLEIPLTQLSRAEQAAARMSSSLRYSGFGRQVLVVKIRRPAPPEPIERIRAH